VTAAATAVAATSAGPLLARAKVNLALHVVGRRADGYHLLDSLVVFPALGDTLTARLAPVGFAARPTSVQAADGPGSGGPVPVPDAAATRATLAVVADARRREALGADADNLVLRAARHLAEAAGRPLPTVDLVLEKRLPVAAGLGGGSADAAATLLLLNDLWRLGFDAARLAEIGLALGADVPMCLAGRSLRAGGIGEALTPLPPLPPFAIVLANPLRPVATPAVFRRLARRDNPPLPPLPSRFDDFAALVGYLAATRNDLQAAAVAELPVIADVVAALAATGAARVGMSGSGATCFGLFADCPAAEAAAARLADSEPGWWVAVADV
jgi:4-diphosphocytidyl-2-C-methyl-D-erythritol kinase